MKKKSLVEQLIRGEAIASFGWSCGREEGSFVLDDDRVMYIEEQIGRFWREENFWRKRIEFERKSWSFEEWAVDVRLEPIVVDAILRCIEERRWTVLVGEKQGDQWVGERVLGEKFSETDQRVSGKQPGRVLMDRVRV